MSTQFPVVTTVAGAGRRGFIDSTNGLLSAYLDGPLEMVEIPDVYATRGDDGRRSSSSSSSSSSSETGGGGIILIADGRNNCIRMLDLARNSLISLPTHAFLAPRSPVLITGGDAVVLCDSGHNKLRMLQIRAKKGGKKQDHKDERVEEEEEEEGVVEEGADGSSGDLQVEDCTIAGTGRAGQHDGVADQATFNKPTGLCVISDGSILVADSGNHCIRRVAGRPGRHGLYVTTIIGGGASAGGGGEANMGCIDGDVTTARLCNPTSLTVDAYGTILVCDTGNHSIRALHPPPDGDMSAHTWALTTLVGSSTVSLTPHADGSSSSSPRYTSSGHEGFVDGDAATQASLRDPTGISVIPSALVPEVAICDSGNNSIRLLTSSKSASTATSTPTLHENNNISSSAATNSVYTLGSTGVLEQRVIPEGNYASDHSLSTERSIVVLRGNAGIDASGSASSSVRKILVVSSYLAAPAGAGTSKEWSIKKPGSTSQLYSTLFNLGNTSANTTTGPPAASSASSSSQAQVVVYPDPLGIYAVHARYSTLTTIAGAPSSVVDAVAHGALIETNRGARRGIVASTTTNDNNKHAIIDTRILSKIASDAPAAIQTITAKIKAAGGSHAQQAALAALSRYQDGPSHQARLRKPHSILFPSNCGGTALITDAGNSLIRALVSAKSILHPPSVLVHGGSLSPSVIQQGRVILASSSSSKGQTAIMPQTLEAGYRSKSTSTTTTTTAADAPTTSASGRRGSTASSGMRDYVAVVGTGGKSLATPASSSSSKQTSSSSSSSSSSSASMVQFGDVSNISSNDDAQVASYSSKNHYSQQSTSSSHTATTALHHQQSSTYAATSSASKNPVSRHTGGMNTSSTVNINSKNHTQSYFPPSLLIAGHVEPSHYAPPSAIDVRLANSADPLAAGFLAAAALSAPAGAPGDVERLAADPATLLNASVSLLEQSGVYGNTSGYTDDRGNATISITTGGGTGGGGNNYSSNNAGARNHLQGSGARRGSSEAGAGKGNGRASSGNLGDTIHNNNNNLSNNSGPRFDRPVGWKFEDEVAADRRGNLVFASGSMNSRDLAAAEEKTTEGYVVKALLMGRQQQQQQTRNTDGSSTTAGSNSSSASMLHARYARHTLASANYVRAHTHIPVVRGGAPAYVNVGKLVQGVVKDLQAKANVGSNNNANNTNHDDDGDMYYPPRRHVGGALPRSSSSQHPASLVGGKTGRNKIPTSKDGTILDLTNVKVSNAGALIAAALSPRQQARMGKEYQQQQQQAVRQQTEIKESGVLQVLEFEEEAAKHLPAESFRLNNNNNNKNTPNINGYADGRQRRSSAFIPQLPALPAPVLLTGSSAAAHAIDASFGIVRSMHPSFRLGTKSGR